MIQVLDKRGSEIYGCRRVGRLILASRCSIDVCIALLLDHLVVALGEAMDS